jgi:hypothetical protein
MCNEPLTKAEYIKRHGTIAYWQHQAKIHEDNASVCFLDDPVAQERLKTMAEIFRTCADDIIREPGPVVEVKQYEHTYTHPPVTVTLCDPGCTFWCKGHIVDIGSTFSPEYNRVEGHCILGLSDKLNDDEPGPDCPGAGTYKLTPVEVDDE